MSDAAAQRTAAASERERADRRRLADLPAGSVGRLCCRDLSEGEACLLAAMGMTDGCSLTVRTSGDPCIVEVRSTRIGLARSVASRLALEPAPASGAPPKGR